MNIAIKITDYYAPRKILPLYLETNEKIQSLIKKLKTNKRVLLHTGEWQQLGKYPLKEAWDKETYDYLIWPCQAGYHQHWVVNVLDVVNKKIAIHTASQAKDADQEREQVAHLFKYLKDYKITDDSLVLDLGDIPAKLTGEDSCYIAILYVQHALKNIKKDTYDYTISSAKYDVPDAKDNDRRTPLEQVQEQYKQLLTLTKDLPSLTELDKEAGGTYTDEDLAIFSELGIEKDKEKQQAVKECYRLLDIFNEQVIKKEDPDKTIELKFATIKEDGTEVNCSELSEESLSSAIENDDGAIIYLKLDRYDSDQVFQKGLLWWSFTHSLALAWLKIKRQLGKRNQKLSVSHSLKFWNHFLHNPDATYKFVKQNILEIYWKTFYRFSLPSEFPETVNMVDTLSCYFPNATLKRTYETFPEAQPADVDIDDLKDLKVIENVTVSLNNADTVWKALSRELVSLINEEFEKDKYDKTNIDCLWFYLTVLREKNHEFNIRLKYHKDNPLADKMSKLLQDIQWDASELRKKINNYQEQVSELNDQIDEKDQKIDEKTQELEQKEQEIEEKSAENTKQWDAIDKLVQLVNELSISTTNTTISPSKKSDEPEKQDNSKQQQQDELKKYEEILETINDPEKKSLKDLPEDFCSQEIEALNNDLLPADKQKETLTARIKERRDNFFFWLDNKEESGLNADELKEALELIAEDNVWKAEDKNPITVEILNEVLGLVPNNNAEVEDLTKYFKNKGGYELPKSVKDEEATFTGDKAWMSNGAILRDCFKRSNWHPDNPTFPIDWPYPTSSGKSSICPACLFGSARERELKGTGEGLNVIVVSPTTPATQELFNHFSTWLQYEDWNSKKPKKPWRCPIHLRDHGGEFPTAKNDLTYYDSVEYVETPNPDPTKKTPILKAQRTEGQGKKGISVMEDKWLLIYLVREVIAINKIKCTVGKDKKRIEEGKLIVKSKLINKKDSVLIFDENDMAKNGTTNYIKLQQLAEKLGYKVVKASATAPDREFSITMPKKGERKYMEGGLVANYIDNDGNEVDLNKNMANGKSLVFLPKAELTDEQETILQKKKIGYFVLDETLELASTGLTCASPNGYVFFGDSRYSRAFTFFINTCISLVEMELKKLNKEWFYEGDIQPVSDSELLQQSGRVRRIMEGNFIAVSKRKLTDKNFTKEIDPTDDIASMMIEAVLTGKLSELDKIYPSLINVGGGAVRKTPTALLMQSAIALPFEDGKGRYPEEILIGLTKGGAGTDLYPQFGVQKMPPAADKDLWARFEGNYKPKQIQPVRAKEILFLMVSNLIGNQKKFPNKITLNLENPLISQAGFKEKDFAKTKQSKIYENSVAEIRKVILGIIAKKIKQPEQIKYRDKDEFDQVAELLKFTLDSKKINIEIIREETEKLKNPKDPSEGKLLKDNLTLKINYN